MANDKVRVESHKAHVSMLLAAALSDAVSAVAAMVEGEAKKNLQSMVYSRPESEDYRRTGNLINSVHTVKSGSTEAAVVADADYAVYVHEGTRNTSPRPFLENARRVVEPKTADVVRRELKRKGF